MKKSTLESIRNYLNGDETVDLTVLRAEVNAEWARLSDKAQMNKDIYAMAHDVAMNALRNGAMTVKDTFSACEGKWPDGFTVGKLQYAFLHYWNDELIKHDNGKSAFTYSVK